MFPRDLIHSGKSIFRSVRTETQLYLSICKLRSITSFFLCLPKYIMHISMFSSTFILLLHISCAFYLSVTFRSCVLSDTMFMIEICAVVAGRIGFYISIRRLLLTTISKTHFNAVNLSKGDTI